MNLIAARDKHWGIGKGGDLLYHIREDLHYFREKTKGHVIVVGRKTLESFPGARPLKDRINIVLTSDREYEGRGALVLHSPEEVFDTVSGYDPDDVFICGGGEIYRLFAPCCRRAYITEIMDDGRADTFMPDLDREPGWKKRECGDWMESDGMLYRFTVYENQKPKEYIG